MRRHLQHVLNGRLGTVRQPHNDVSHYIQCKKIYTVEGLGNFGGTADSGNKIDYIPPHLFPHYMCTNTSAYFRLDRQLH
jgi:hypothetical protein